MPAAPDSRLTALVDRVARLVHEDAKIEAAREVAAVFRVNPPKTEKDAELRLQQFVGVLLGQNRLQEAARVLWTPAKFNPKPECSQQVWNLFDTSAFGLIMGAGSMSKCLGEKDLCRLFDGRLVAAAEIQTGEVLAGDDGTPRRVLHTARGRATMYRVTPHGVPAFECNGDHILSLICTWTRKNNGGRYGISSGYTPGKIVDVPIREYLTWGKQRKEAYRLFLGVAPMPEVPVKVDPYVYGSWLGDGTRVRAELTTPAGPMASRWCEYWVSQGFVVDDRNGSGACGTWAVRDSARTGREAWPNKWFRESVVNDEKRIRPEYLQNSESVRLGVLAGLIDSDGCASGAGFEITTKWRGLRDDIEALARSLGFAVTVFQREHGIKSTGFKGLYWHVFLMGDCVKIPTREKKTNRKSSRGVTAGRATTRFTVEDIGEGAYAGFTLDGNHRFLLGSGIVTHNSYTMGVRLFLEWLRDPDYTALKVIGPSKEHLEANLFSHLVDLHDNASIPLPGKVGELWIGMDRRQQLGSIKGIVVPVGRAKKAARLQGTKRKPRPTPHKEFGDLSRLFIFLDEIENVPGGIWSDIDNVMSNVNELGIQGFKIFGAYNPTNQEDEVGKRAEPVKGWANLDPEKDFRWTSKRGWEVLRLDGEKSENVVANRTVYPGLQTRAGLDQIARNSGGFQSAGYYSMGRGLYPPQGIALTVIPPGMVHKARGEFIWFDTPKAVGGLDLALEGGASAVYTLGKLGLASGVKYSPTLKHPKGETVMFKDKEGRIVPRWGLQADNQFKLEKGDTPKMAAQGIKTSQRAAVAGRLFACDRTGHGAGAADLMRNDWSGEIHDINYSQSPNDKKIMAEDTQTAKEEYPRIDSELWFGLRKWLEFGYFILGPNFEITEVVQQLTQRQYSTKGGKTCVESKKDYKGRGHVSPDEADSLTLFVYAARIGEGITPSMVGEGAEMPAGGDQDDWPGSYPNGVRLDPTSRTDYLEDELL